MTAGLRSGPLPIVRAVATKEIGQRQRQNYGSEKIIKCNANVTQKTLRECVKKAKKKGDVTRNIAFVTSEVDAKALHVTIAVKMSQSSRMASFLSRLNPHGNHLQIGAVRRAADAAAASASTAAAAAASAAPATAASRAEEEMLLLRTGLADADIIIIIAFVLEADSRGEHRNALFPGLQEACTMYSESQLRERVAYLVLTPA